MSPWATLGSRKATSARRIAKVSRMPDHLALIQSVASYVPEQYQMVAEIPQHKEVLSGKHLKNERLSSDPPCTYQTKTMIAMEMHEPHRKVGGEVLVDTGFHGTWCCLAAEPAPISIFSQTRKTRHTFFLGAVVEGYVVLLEAAASRPRRTQISI